MRSLAVLIVVAAAACPSCGDNTYVVGQPLAQAANLTIIAHQDDDLLFMQPDLYEAVRAGGVTNVYVTAGNGTEGVAYAERRYAGLRSAYASAAGADFGDWDCGWITIAGHLAQHCRLHAERISLVFLAYPDGGKEGEEPTSLLNLWEGNLGSATTVSARPASYDQAGLIATIAEIIGDTQPAQIRTLEVASTHGRDHSDHMIVGALAMLGAAAAGTTAQITSYRGYNTESEPTNQLPPLYAAAAKVVEHYDACVDHCATCGEPCAMLSDPTHVTWLSRRYAVGMWRGPLTGVLSDGTHCATASSSGSIMLAACDPLPPAWTFDANGLVHVDATRCLQVLPTGELSAGDCTPRAATAFRFDDEGHVWAGTPPVATTGMDYDHLDCFGNLGGRVHASLCGMANPPPVWQLLRPLVTTARPIGVAPRLGDVDGDQLADLCWVDGSDVDCMLGDGTGGFAAPATIASLDVTADSLATGAFGSDLPAACGRDGSGIACVADGGSAAELGSAFATAPAAADATLAFVDDQLCGLDAAGFACTTADGDETTRSPFPTGASSLWPGDVDGDGRPDFCEPSDNGPLCSLTVDDAASTDANAYGFAEAGAVQGGSDEPLTFDNATTALADVSGDGRADLCSLVGDQVQCAFSTGRGFSPRTLLVQLPAGTAPDRLWLGDLDGDGKADACTGNATAITCALSP